MKTNTKKPSIYTHGGAVAQAISPHALLRRSVLSCLLWENEAYEDGQLIADRIQECALRVDPKTVHDLAIEARLRYGLRHVPLLLLSVRPNADAIYQTIQRADELAELLSIYWRNGKKPIPAQMKKGLARAFTKFDEYALAKYNRDAAIKLKDVLFMVHPKPLNDAQAQLWKKLVDNSLQTPDTWEVALSSGADKKATWERLLREDRLGYLALIRNLRNMEQAGVESTLVHAKIREARGANKVLPFRFVAAAKHAPQFEASLDVAMQSSIDALPRLAGATVVLVDVSGSMDTSLSERSDITRLDAAATLASIVKSDFLRVFTFSEKIVEVPARRGMSGVDAVKRSQPHGGTLLKNALQAINNSVSYDRIIVITDEQSQDGCADPTGRGYMINVASNRNGVGYGVWRHIDGFSENVLRYIYETENQQ